MMRQLDFHRPHPGRRNIAVMVEDGSSEGVSGQSTYLITGLASSEIPLLSCTEPDPIGQLRELLANTQGHPGVCENQVLDALLAICYDRISGPQGNQTPNHLLVGEQLKAALALRLKKSPPGTNVGYGSRQALPA